jgi:hypothetical protein
MRIYLVEETPEYDIFGAIVGRFLDRDEAEECARQLTFQGFVEGYNLAEHVIIDLLRDGALVSCGIYSVKDVKETMHQYDDMTWESPVDWELEQSTAFATCVHELDIPIANGMILDPFCESIFIVRESATFRHFSDLKGCFTHSDAAAQVARVCCDKIYLEKYSDEKYRMVEMYKGALSDVVCLCIYDKGNPFIPQSLSNCDKCIPYDWHIPDRASYVVELWRVKLPLVLGDIPD